MDKVNYVEMKHVSELAIIGLLLKPFKTWIVPGKATVTLTRTRGGMLEIELVRLWTFCPVREFICDNKCLWKQQPPWQVLMFSHCSIGLPVLRQLVIPSSLLIVFIQMVARILLTVA